MPYSHRDVRVYNCVNDSLNIFVDWRELYIRKALNLSVWDIEQAHLDAKYFWQNGSR